MNYSLADSYAARILGFKRVVLDFSVETKGVVKMKIRHTVALTAVTAGLTLSGGALASSAITEAEVMKAQEKWISSLLAISAANDTSGKEMAKQVAKDKLDDLYNFSGDLLFKPTLAEVPQNVRTDERGTLAYFVGQDDMYAGDGGFALKPWTAVKIENKSMHLTEDLALVMGNFHFTDKAGNVVTADKSWGYVRGDDGELRLVLHHSSLPYAAK